MNTYAKLVLFLVTASIVACGKSQPAPLGGGAAMTAVTKSIPSLGKFKMRVDRGISGMSPIQDGAVTFESWEVVETSVGAGVTHETRYFNRPGSIDYYRLSPEVTRALRTELLNITLVASPPVADTAPAELTVMFGDDDAVTYELNPGGWDHIVANGDQIRALIIRD